ncbi:MAG: AsmA family protein [Nitrosomonas sp.]|nr:AsmA family protein [Nitrosomonas sp.]
MKRFITLGWLLLTLVLLISGAALFIVNYKPVLLIPAVEQWVKLNSQRSLRIAGGLRFSFFPQPSLLLNDLSLSEYQRDDWFVSAEEIKITVSLRPLFNRQLVVNDVRISGLQARFVRYQDGTMNIADLLQAGDASFFDAFDIAQMEIENSRLRFQDDMTRQLFELKALRLAAMHVTAESLRQVKMQTHMSFNDRQRTGSADSATVQLKTQFEAEDIVFSQGKLASGPVFLSAQTAPEDGGAGTAEHISTRISIAGLNRIEGILSSQHVHMELGLRHSGYSMETVLDTAIEVNMHGMAGALPGLQLAFDFFHPDYLSKPISGYFKGHLDIDGVSEWLHMDLQGQIDGQAVKTTVRLQDFAQQTRVFKIEINQLDLTALLPVGQPDAVPEVSDAQSEDAMLPDFSRLEKLGLNGSIQIGQLSVGDIRLSDIQLMLQPEKNNSPIKRSE